MGIGIGKHLTGMNNFLIFVLLLTTTACQSETGAKLKEVNLVPTAEMAIMKWPASTQSA